MRELKNFIIQITDLFLIVYLLINSEKHLTILFIFIYFSIKYFCYKQKINQFDAIIKQKLKNQREYFLNSLNHDLRIPVLAQLRAIELLNKNLSEQFSSYQNDMMIQVEESCKCVLNLISLLINTYKIENNSYTLIYNKFNISEVIISCLDELLVQASEKNITFEFEGKSKDLFITADKTEIKKVIYNLIATSLVFSKFGGKVNIKINNSDSSKIRLFVNFAGNHTNFDTKYTTIGQSIRMHFCKKIVEFHNGTLLFFSKANSFIVELPKIAQNAVKNPNAV